MDAITELTQDRDRHEQMLRHPAATAEQRWYHTGARDALDAALAVLRRHYLDSLTGNTG